VSWKDVTADCDMEYGVLYHEYFANAIGTMGKGYRLTRISGPLTPHVAFIVEKEE
jgi:hypothetical protein